MLKIKTVLILTMLFFVPVVFAAGPEEGNVEGDAESDDEFDDIPIEVEYAEGVLDTDTGEGQAEPVDTSGDSDISSDSDTSSDSASGNKIDEIAGSEKKQINFKGVLLEKGSRKPLAGFTVYIKDTDFSAVTDEKGEFFFYNLPPKKVTVVIPAIDYATFTTEETIEKNQLVTVKYFLELRSQGVLEVVVRDKKIEKEVSRTVLKINEAKLVPGTGGDPVKAIESMPGVGRGMSGNELVIRGSNAEDSKFFIDG
ncbi:MAG: carboxypeptidase-like regulatory domain-containing protein, partial [Deltaproteobacteria bacterium]|nr:carboxypeptidase-like regulatory domain-containing protein [Deltaproteobacteria bacterium]